MTKQEAEIILLKNALEQAQSVVRFMHGCLTSPQLYSYNYSEHTQEYLKEWEQLVPRGKYCVHSRYEPTCENCENSEKERLQLMKAKAVLYGN